MVFFLNPSDCHRSPCQLSHICSFTYLTLHSSAVETVSQLFPTWSSFFSTASQGPQLGHIRAGPWILRSTGSCTPAWGEGCGEIRERNGYRTTLCQGENWVLLRPRKSKSYDATFGSPVSLQAHWQVTQFPESYSGNWLWPSNTKNPTLPTLHYFQPKQFYRSHKRNNLIWISSMNQICWHL